MNDVPIARFEIDLPHMRQSIANLIDQEADRISAEMHDHVVEVVNKAFDASKVKMEELAVSVLEKTLSDVIYGIVSSVTVREKIFNYANKQVTKSLKELEVE